MTCSTFCSVIGSLAACGLLTFLKSESLLSPILNKLFRRSRGVFKNRKGFSRVSMNYNSGCKMFLNVQETQYFPIKVGFQCLSANNGTVYNHQLIDKMIGTQLYQARYQRIVLYNSYCNKLMDCKGEILGNRNRIRNQMIKLNIAKRTSEQNVPQKNSPQNHPKIDSGEFFDRVLKQKCETQSSFQELFKIHEKLGEGAQSMVRRVVDKKTGANYAAKIIGHADAEKIMGIKSQYKLLKTLDLPTVIRAYYLFISQEESTCRLVLEFCDWPTLQDQINQIQFSEEIAAQVGKTLLETVDYLHSHGVCHRDIKPENILYSMKDSALKLIDFEVSALIHPSEVQMWTMTGSLFYKAPQMFRGSYTNKVDVWAVGIVIYELIHGHPPFAKEFVDDTIEEITNTPVQIYFDQDLDPFTQDFLKKCLAKNPEERYTAKAALKEPFILQASNRSVTPKDDNKLNLSFQQGSNSGFISQSKDVNSYFLKKLSVEGVSPQKPRMRSKTQLFDAEFGIRLEAKNSQNSQNSSKE